MTTSAVAALAGATKEVTLAALDRAAFANPGEAQEAIGGILAMADAWARGDLPLAEVGRLSTGYERFLAVRFGPRPVPKTLLRLIDALIDAVPGPDGYAYRTKDGLYTEAEIAAAKGTYVRDLATGKVAIRFPLHTPRQDKGRWDG
jgi:hypothetical protein